LESLSEQELVDCTNGGEMSHGFIEVIENHGDKIDPGAIYAYTIQFKGKYLADDSKIIGHFTSYLNVTSGDALKAVVAGRMSCISCN